MATHTWKGLDEYTLPEMLRVPLDETILQLKMLNVTDVRGFFRRALDPPSHAALDQALTSLTGLQALEGVQLFHGEDAGAFGQERNATESLLDSMDRDIAMDGHLTPLGCVVGNYFGGVSMIVSVTVLIPEPFMSADSIWLHWRCLHESERCLSLALYFGALGPF